MFFEEFSILLESLTITPEHLLLVGDYSFHVDVTTDREALKFLDLIDSAGLQQWVHVPTHRNGHTLDLIMDRQDQTLSPCSIETQTD